MAERRGRAKPTSDIYTALAAIALIVLICGIGYLWYRQYQFTGTYNPIDFKPDPANSAAVTQVEHSPVLG